MKFLPGNQRGLTDSIKHGRAPVAPHRLESWHHSEPPNFTRLHSISNEGNLCRRHGHPNEGVNKIMPTINRPRTKILVDGGDPEETARIKQLLGYVDGQTTNPSLVAKNPDIRKRIAAGHALTRQEEQDAYREIVRHISPLVGDAGVSIEVFADLNTSPRR